MRAIRRIVEACCTEGFVSFLYAYLGGAPGEAANSVRREFAPTDPFLSS